MSIGLFPVGAETKVGRDAIGGVIFPLIEPWIPPTLDWGLRHEAPAARRFDTLSTARMLRFELLHASQPEASFRQTLRQVWQNLLRAGLVEGAPPTRGGVARARQRVPPWAFTMLLKHTAEIAERVEDCSLWPNHRLLSIDGVPLTAANTPANRAYFGVTSSQHGEAYFPQANAVWVSRVFSRTVIAEHFGSSRQGDERVGPRLLRTVLRPNDLVLGDSHYGGYANICTVPAAGAFYMVRSPGPLDLQKHVCQRFTDDDLDVRLQRTAYVQRSYPDLLLPDYIHTRALRYSIPSRDKANGVELAYFLTNLPRQEYSRARLAVLPPLRWNQETLNNDVKTRIGLGELLSLTPEGAYLEVLAHLVLSNFIRLALLTLRPDRPLLGSFTSCLSAMRNANADLRTSPEEREHILDTMCQMILSEPIEVRPNRTEPRMTRPRRKPYPIFKSLRQDWRADRKRGETATHN